MRYAPPPVALPPACADAPVYDRSQLITPFLDLDIKYYDLGMEHRDATDDKVTIEAAEAIQKYGVGIKVRCQN